MNNHPDKQKSWQRHPLTQFAALLVGTVPLYATVIYSGLISVNLPPLGNQSAGGALFNSLVMVVAFGGLALLALYLLCGERLQALNGRPGNWQIDLTHGALLAFGIGVAQLALATILTISSPVQPNDATFSMATEMLANPWLLAVFLGPIIWLQAAIFEEFIHVFTLTRIFNIWPGRTAQVLGVIAAALLFGLGHLYQGIFGFIGTALIALILGTHYLIFRRIWPLILAHGIYDTVAVLLLITAIDRGMEFPTAGLLP